MKWQPSGQAEKGIVEIEVAERTKTLPEVAMARVPAEVPEVLVAAEVPDIAQTLQVVVVITIIVGELKVGFVLHH